MSGPTICLGGPMHGTSTNVCALFYNAPMRGPRGRGASVVRTFRYRRTFVRVIADTFWFYIPADWPAEPDSLAIFRFLVDAVKSGKKKP